MSARFGPFRALSILVGLMFLAFAAVQYNDPDPVQWMAVYGVAAVLSLLTAFGVRYPWLLPVLHGLVAAVWAVAILTGLWGKHVDFSQVFATIRMVDSSVEETREDLGLLIVVVWMMALAWYGRRRAVSPPR
jgi:transmembrane protein TMEM220